jgi:exopolysaccharide biosynthesis polyprenyl glycosylphosphotransferase
VSQTKTIQARQLLGVLDIVVAVLVFLVSLNVYDATRGIDAGRYVDYYALMIVTVAFFALCRRFSREQLHLHVRPFWKQAVAVVQTVLISVGITVVLLFLLKIEFVSRLIYVGFALGTIVTLVLLRAFLHWWYFVRSGSKTENNLRVLIIGSGRRAQKLSGLLARNERWGFDFIGYLDPDDPNRYSRRKTDKVLGHVNQISEILAREVVDEIIVAVPRSMLMDLQMIINACQEEGVQLRFMADFYDFEAARIRLELIDNIPLLSFEPVARDERTLLIKRFFDLIVVIAAFPLLLPLFAVVALVIKLDSPGPAFFLQDRVGLHKRRFKMFKFRSMVVDAEARMAEVEHLNESDGPNFKVKDDPRMTKVGRFIRKTSIDELPQLINVFQGDMSLVGPRPMSIRDVDLFDKGIQRRRFSVRPGITCLWQISGRSDLSFDEWLELDLQYIDGWSLGLDFKILLMTIPTVLKGSGAS